MQPIPTEPVETTYTFRIAPSTDSARTWIIENQSYMRGTLAQGRDLARTLDASIDLLFDTGYTAFHIRRDGLMPCEIEPEAHLEHSCPDCGGDRDYPGLCDSCSPRERSAL